MIMPLDNESTTIDSYVYLSTLKKSHLDKCSAIASTLNNSDAINSRLIRCNLKDCHINNCTIQDSTIKNVRIKDCYLLGADISDDRHIIRVGAICNREFIAYKGTLGTIRFSYMDGVDIQVVEEEAIKETIKSYDDSAQQAGFTNHKSRLGEYYRMIDVAVSYIKSSMDITNPSSTTNPYSNDNTNTTNDDRYRGFPTREGYSIEIFDRPKPKSY